MWFPLGLMVISGILTSLVQGWTCDPFWPIIVVYPSGLAKGWAHDPNRANFWSSFLETLWKGKWEGCKYGWSCSSAHILFPVYMPHLKKCGSTYNKSAKARFGHRERMRAISSSKDLWVASSLGLSCHMS